MEEKTYFKNAEGLKLCGVLSKPQQENGKCIILCHGITVDKDEYGIYAQLAKKLTDVGFTVFRFDFRGHGESEGDSVDLTVIGEKRDLEAATGFLQSLGYKSFGIIAASFGGGAASLFTSENQKMIKALVFWNAIIDYHDILDPQLAWSKKNFGPEQMEKLKEQGYIRIGSQKFKIGPALFDDIKTLKPFESLQNIQVPTLFVHGDADSYVPYDDSVKYSQLFKNAQLETIKGADHGFHKSEREANQADEATIKFLLKHV